MRILYFLYITWIGANYVLPLSFENKMFKVSLNPADDLAVISAQHTNFISKRWFNKIMNDFVEEQFKIAEKYSPLESAIKQRHNFENMNNIHILNHINILEKIFQTPMKDKYSYYAWMPIEEKNNVATDIIALVVCDETTDATNVIIKCVIPNPCWCTKNIDSKELKLSLIDLGGDNRYLNLTEFYDNKNNIRLKLDWTL